MYFLCKDLDPLGLGVMSDPTGSWVGRPAAAPSFFHDGRRCRALGSLADSLLVTPGSCVGFLEVHVIFAVLALLQQNIIHT